MRLDDLFFGDGDLSLRMRLVRKAVIAALAVGLLAWMALLCGACNRGIGFFRDRASTLRAAVAYLAKHAPKLRGIR